MLVAILPPIVPSPMNPTTTSSAIRYSPSVAFDQHRTGNLSYVPTYAVRCQIPRASAQLRSGSCRCGTLCAQCGRRAAIPPAMGVSHTAMLAIHPANSRLVCCRLIADHRGDLDYRHVGCGPWRALPGAGSDATRTFTEKCP